MFEILISVGYLLINLLTFQCGEQGAHSNAFTHEIESEACPRVYNR